MSATAKRYLGVHRRPDGRQVWRWSDGTERPVISGGDLEVPALTPPPPPPPPAPAAPAPAPAAGAGAAPPALDLAALLSTPPAPAGDPAAPAAPGAPAAPPADPVTAAISVALPELVRQITEQVGGTVQSAIDQRINALERNGRLVAKPGDPPAGAPAAAPAGSDVLARMVEVAARQVGIESVRTRLGFYHGPAESDLAASLLAAEVSARLAATPSATETAVGTESAAAVASQIEALRRLHAEKAVENLRSRGLLREDQAQSLVPVPGASTSLARPGQRSVEQQLADGKALAEVIRPRPKS